MLGSGEIEPQKNEIDMINKIRRSAAASRDLEEGYVLQEHDLIWVRPGSGIIIGQEDRILGKSLKRSISYAEMIQPSDVDN